MARFGYYRNEPLLTTHETYNAPMRFTKLNVLRLCKAQRKQTQSHYTIFINQFTSLNWSVAG